MEPIWGEGPSPARVAIVGEAPGKDEVKAGRPFVGASGRVLWPFVRRYVGLNREACYVTNLCKLQFTEAQEKDGLTDAEMSEWGVVLDAELEAVGPEYVLAVGKHAARHFLADHPIPVSMELVHGLAYQVGSRIVVPAWHPAAGIRNSRYLNHLAADLQAFSRALDGQTPIRTRSYANRDYAYTTEADLDLLVVAPQVAIDTEYEGTEPLMLSWSVGAGHGRLILANDHVLLDRFNRELHTHRIPILLHNALADMEPLRRMGVEVADLPMRDTMALAWYQETEPQGLKALAWRHCGVIQPAFEEVAGPTYRSALEAYLTAAVELTKPTPVPRTGKKGKPLNPGPGKASRGHKLAKRFLGDAAKGAVADYEKRWNGWAPEVKREWAELLGPAPLLSLRTVPIEQALPYACGDADLTYRLDEILPPYSLDVSRTDHAVLPMVAAMERRGLLVDLSRQAELAAEVANLKQGALGRLREAAGRSDFNPNSADDIALVLYGFSKVAPGIYDFLQDREYLLPPNFTKRGRPKTDKKALGTLRDEHVLPAMLLEYKELEKLDNTYVRPLPGYLRDDVLHPNFRHTRVPSGRFAAVRPNIMAIPARTALGLKVRSLFVARPGFKLIAFDHSQVELRLAACISADPTMIQAFLDGADLHRRTAALILGRQESDVPSTIRTLFKKINFGILYGATAERIYLELLADGVRDFTREDTKRFVEEWLRLYAGVASAIANTGAEIAATDYVTDMWGRRRRLAAGTLSGRIWPASALREEAVRQGFNHKVQGGAQGLMKDAMRSFWTEVMPAMCALGHEMYPLLQIHDELIFEVPDNEEALQAAEELGLAAMTRLSSTFDVPIEASCKVAADWGGLK